MKLIEAYANNCGVKIPANPVLPYTSFYPLPFSKYITIHPSSGMTSKNYDYYPEVLLDIYPILKKYGYNIIQLGDSQDKPLENCYDLRGKVDLYQASFLIKNSALHLGNDSVWAHVAGLFKVPFVVPYGPTYANVCSPYFSGQKVLIESHRNGKRASCSPVEEPKTINFIMPEEISNAVLGLLGIEERISRKTLYIGSDYLNFQLNVIPTSPHIDNAFSKIILDIRGDICYEKDSISQLINTSKCNVHISQPDMFDLGLLSSNRANINSVIFHVESPERAIASLGFLKFIKANFSYAVEYEGPEANAGIAKCHLFDFNFFKKEKKECPIQLDENLKVQSKNLFYANGKIYLSKWHYDHTIFQPTIENNIGNVVDDPDFWLGLDNYLLFK